MSTSSTLCFLVELMQRRTAGHKIHEYVKKQQKQDASCDIYCNIISGCNVYWCYRS